MKICDRRWITTLRLAVMASFCVLVVGCGGEPKPEIMAGIDGCASCGMVIDRVNEAAGWIEGGDFVPFCSPGCLLAEHDALRKSGQAPPEAVFLADYQLLFIIVGVLSNIVGITIMLENIQRHNLSRKLAHWQWNMGLVRKGTMVLAVLVFAATVFRTLLVS